MTFSANELRNRFSRTPCKFRSSTEAGAISDVNRLVPEEDDAPLMFNKTVHGKFSTWIKYENDLLINLNLYHEDAHVVKTLDSRVSKDANGKVEQNIVTQDAGIDLVTWYQTGFTTPSGHTYANIMSHPVGFLLIAINCIKALYSIHKHGVIHCDIKEDNICIPFRTINNQDLITVDFANTTIIDFGFSLWWRSIPLGVDKTLPLNTQDPLPYQAKSLINALKMQIEEKQKTGINEFNHDYLKALNYSVDLYSIGYMLDNMLRYSEKTRREGDDALWDVFEEAFATWAAKLKGFKLSLKPPYTKQHLPHPEYIDTLESMLNDLAAALPKENRKLVDNFEITLNFDAANPHNPHEGKKTPLAMPTPLAEPQSIIVPPPVEENKRSKFVWLAVATIAIAPITLYLFNQTSQISDSFPSTSTIDPAFTGETKPPIEPVQSAEDIRQTELEAQELARQAEEAKRLAEEQALAEKAAEEREAFENKIAPIFRLNDDKLSLVDTVTESTWYPCGIGQTWDTSKYTCLGEATLFQNRAAVDRAVSKFNATHSGDWRLPSLKELHSLLTCKDEVGSDKLSLGDAEFEVCRPQNDAGSAVLNINEQAFTNLHQGSFWTADFYKDNKETPLAISFTGGENIGVHLEKNNDQGAVLLVQ